VIDSAVREDQYDVGDGVEDGVGRGYTTISALGGEGEGRVDAYSQTTTNSPMRLLHTAAI
jgi:hypothetical protein